jgi:hypothetical protein
MVILSLHQDPAILGLRQSFGAHSWCLFLSGLLLLHCCEFNADLLKSMHWSLQVLLVPLRLLLLLPKLQVSLSVQLLLAFLLLLVQALNLSHVLGDPAPQRLHLVLLDLNVKSLLLAKVFKTLYFALQAIWGTNFTLYQIESLLIVSH